MSAIEIRLATVDDLPTINAIYNYYVQTSTCTFQEEPESEEGRLNWFRSRTVTQPVTVVEVDGSVAGWASLSHFRPRSAYRFSVEPSVYLRNDVHGRGLGKATLQDLIDRARSCGYHTLLGGVCTEQTASIKLQESMGFTRVALLTEVGFKFGRWLDVAYYQLML